MTETVTLTREELNALIDERVGQAAQRSGFDPFSDMPDQVNAIRRSQPATKTEQMEQMAEQRGGLWLARYPEMRKYKSCRHAKPRQCDKCWTPETEARWAFALGLSDKVPIGLDDEELPGSQRGSDPVRRIERGPGGRPRRAPDEREPAHT